MRRVDRVAKELRDGDGLPAAARRLAELVHDPETPPAAVAACARELRMMLGALAAAPKAEQGDVVDDLAARRKARRTS